MIKNSFLTALGYQYHSEFKTMHCMECEMAIPIKQLTAHPATHKIKLLNVSNTQKQLDAYVLNDIQEVNRLIPLSGGPPVQGLKVISGFKCTQCHYTAVSERGVQSQFLKDHPQLAKMPTHQRSIPAQIQHFFNQKTSTYFTVNPELQQLPLDSPYAIYLRNPITIKSSTITSPSKGTQDLHPLTVMTGWYYHVEPYMGNKRTILELVTLCALPGAQEPHLKDLGTHVTAFLHKCFVLAKQSSELILQMLEQYPM